MSFILFDMEFIEKEFKFHLVPYLFFFLSTLSPVWPPEEITKSYDRYKKMLVLQFYSLYFSMLDVDCFDFAYPA